jgi:hypothetical protein
MVLAEDPAVAAVLGPPTEAVAPDRQTMDTSTVPNALMPDVARAGIDHFIDRVRSRQGFDPT